MRRWFVLLVCALAVLTTIPTPVLADMNLPEFNAGDKWVYSVNLKLEDMAILYGEWEYEVRGETQDSGYQVYDVSISGEGNATFGDIFGVLGYTLDGFIYMRVSDLATVKESMMVDFDIPDFISGNYFFAFMNITYNPPLNGYDFPIKEGDTWSATTSTTFGVEIVTDLMPVNSTSATVSVTTDFEVESKETVEVAAGKFATYVIKATEADGNTTYTYMSTKAGYMVKSRLYNSTGVSMGSMNLKSYSYTAPGGDGDLLSDILDLWPFIVLIIVILAIIGVIIRIRQRRGNTESEVESPSEQEPPPPSE
ncbi:MAG: hypothetical protein KAR39_10810 [Thermoplasmata archaeon]|nr:hypothetical protein [Thermoplasmata archaeon]